MPYLIPTCVYMYVCELVSVCTSVSMFISMLHVDMLVCFGGICSCICLSVCLCVCNCMSVLHKDISFYRLPAR